jgi:hypothetical protein
MKLRQIRLNTIYTLDFKLSSDASIEILKNYNEAMQGEDSYKMWFMDVFEVGMTEARFSVCYDIAARGFHVHLIVLVICFL